MNMLSGNAKRLLQDCSGNWSIELPSAYLSLTSAEADEFRRKASNLVAKIQNSGHAGNEQFVIPPGDYLFTADSQQHPVLCGLQGMTIIARGVTFWFEPPLRRGLLFRRCEGITVDGLQIDFAVPCWFQAQITSIDRQSSCLRARIAPGYEPIDVDGNREFAGERACMFYREDGSFIVHRHTPTKWRLLDDGESLHGEVGRYGIPRALKPGDYIVGSLRAGFALGTEDCREMRFRDIHIWSSPGSAVWDGRSPRESGHICDGDYSPNPTLHPDARTGGHQYCRLRATRRPGTNRLHAFGSDIFHLAGSDHGPTLEGCELAYGSDDTFNIHGEFGRVVAMLDTKRVFLEGAYAVGDTLEFRDCSNLQLLGHAKVLSAQRVSNGPSIPINENFRAERDFLVEIDPPLNLAPLSLVVMDGKRSNAFFRICDCWFHDNFQRALINGSPGGVIEHNVFENLGCGICIQFETWGPWMEGPFAHDLIIRGNEFICCAPDAVVIAVAMFPASNDARWDAMPVSNLRIEDNEIDAASGFPIKAQNVDGLRIIGNRIHVGDSSGNRRYTPEAVLPDPRFDWSKGSIQVPIRWLDLQNCDRVTVLSNEIG